MTWFKIDDQLAFHPKVLAAGNMAMGLWARAGSWSAANLTDGRIPRQIVTSMDARTRDADRLIEAGLWVAVGAGSAHAQHHLAKIQPESSQNPAKIEPETDVSECSLCEGVPGYQFVGWTEYQPTKAQVERGREATRIRVREHRNGRRNAVTPGVTNGVSTPAPTRPDPKEEELTTYAPRAPRSAEPKAHRLPDDWEPSEADIAYALERGLEERLIPDLAENFRSHWLNKPGKEGRKIDWSRAWQTWVRNEEKWTKTSNGHGNPRAAASARQHTFADGTPMPWDR